MASRKIEPRVLKEFRDYLPEDALVRKNLFSQISSIFELFGFDPIETPALEYSEILLGNGSEETDKQTFRFTDQGGRDVALRYDLTVPLARFVSQHQNDLTFPFKRSHIGTVWRAEKPQRGRYREFTQCDFDIIGSNSSLADAETLMVVSSFFKKIEVPVLIRINHRVVLSEIIKFFGIADKKVEALRAIDKFDKIGGEGVIAELIKVSDITADKANELITLLVEMTKTKDHEKIFSLISSTIGSSKALDKAFEGLRTVFTSLLDTGCSKEDIQLDITIARGLEYYTGIVFETQLKQLPDIGSVCSGGRYDDLTGLFTARSLPGVGGSVGIDRLLVGLEELQILNNLVKKKARVLIANMNEEDSFKMLHQLRSRNIQSELYPEESKLVNQFKYADKKNIRFVVMKGESEKQRGIVSIKDLLATTEANKQLEVREEDLISKILELTS